MSRVVTGVKLLIADGARRRLWSEEFATSEAEAAGATRRQPRCAAARSRTDASLTYPEVEALPGRLGMPPRPPGTGCATAWGGPFATEAHAYRYLADTYLDG